MDGFWRRGFSGWGGMGLFNGLAGIGMLLPKISAETFTDGSKDNESRG
jgi:hypothetical protein